MNKDILISVGVNYAQGLERFSGYSELYEKHLRKFYESNTFSELERAMEEKDFEKAFAFAHDLKGNTGSLSMNKLYNLVCPFVDNLRKGFDTKKAAEEFPAIRTEYQSLINALKESLR